MWFNFISNYFYHIQDVKPEVTQNGIVSLPLKERGFDEDSTLSGARIPAVAKISSQDLT